MTSFRVDTAPRVLEWARKTAGLSLEDAAKKIGVSVLQLRLWEEGAEEDPTIVQLRAMATAYRRPLAVLLLSVPPPNFTPLKDNRLLGGNRERPYSSDLLSELDRVQMQREVAAELAELAADLPPSIELSLGLTQSAEAAAQAVRGWLGPIPHDQQLQRIDEGRHLNTWIGMIEAKAILVVQISGVAVDEMRGCSYSGPPYPTIVLNGKDTITGRLFTLLHEFVHILLRSGGICDLDERSRQLQTDTETVERFCNSVAAAILMPEADFLERSQLIGGTTSTTWSDTVLADLAKRYGVSREAALLRLVTLGRSSWDAYFSRRPAYTEAQQATQPTTRNLRLYYPIKIRNFGRRYIRSVIDAYRRREINGSDVAEYLMMKIDSLPSLEAALRGLS